MTSGTNRADGSIASASSSCSIETLQQAQLLVEHPAARRAVPEMRRGVGCDLRAARVIDDHTRVSFTRHWSL